MNIDVIQQHAQRLQPVAGLNAANLKLLCRSASTNRIEKSLPLDQSDESRWLVYLLSGSASLKVSAEETIAVDGNTELAARPLFMPGRSYEQVMVTPGSILLRFDRQQYQTLHSKQIADATTAIDVPLESHDNVIFDAILNDFNNQSWTLPVMTDIASKVQRTLKQLSGSSPQQQAHLLSLDPVLSIRLVQLANSAAYGSESPTVSLANALSRLGNQAMHECLHKHTQAQVFKPNSPLIHKRMVDFYMDATLVSYLSTLIAKQIDHIDTEKAAFAGLVHEAGTALVIHHINENTALFNNVEQINTTILKLKATVTTWLLSTWGFGLELSNLCLSTSDWYRLPKEPLGIEHVVTTAMCLVANHNKRLGVPKPHELSITKAILEKSGHSDLQQLLQRAQTDMRAAHKIIMQSAAA